MSHRKPTLASSSATAGCKRPPPAVRAMAVMAVSDSNNAGSMAVLATEVRLVRDRGRCLSVGWCQWGAPLRTRGPYAVQSPRGNLAPGGFEKTVVVLCCVCAQTPSLQAAPHPPTAWTRGGECQDSTSGVTALYVTFVRIHCQLMKARGGAAVYGTRWVEPGRSNGDSVGDTIPCAA